VIGESGSRQFSFGPCAVHGLRKVSRFSRDDSQESVSLRFRHPDIRYCDIFRTYGDYRLVVRLEGSGPSEQLCVGSHLSNLRTSFSLSTEMPRLEQQAIPRAAIHSRTNHFFLVNTLWESGFDSARSIEGFQLFHSTQCLMMMEPS
jgi:hypothetical protein